ncbi:hypothetical protein ABB26_15880 [Stenotrophomonas humi]|uniref:Secreted protein n=1 Tax=Stenotrophomonas humi TaxID=405444 RepID=A0A0R0C7Z0_9GAMM|nr:hypothetical protein [Stenotrophomonas humi]KRG62602.1 hypothetical protein ABB26_15880 [Stenotrophomonas humi]
MKTHLLLAASLLLTTPLAWAQRDYQPIEQRLSAEQLQQIGLSAQQLQLLNRMLSEAQAAAPAQEPSPEAAPVMHIGLEEGPVHSKVQGAVDGWEPGTLFVLENGQQWKVLKGQMRLRQTLQSPQIEVVPGIAGRWFLQVDEDLPKARVYRVR